MRKQYFPLFTDGLLKKKSYCSEKLERKWTLTKWLISKGTFLISFLFWESRQELILAGG